MREILFRGKRVDNGEWVQGYICRYGWTGKEKNYIIPDYTSVLFTAEINPETVGQYTGLTDTNGRKIFEGDIIENIVTGEKGVIQWFDEYSAFMIWSRTKNAIYFLYDNAFSRIHIVGNAFDNPELLKADKEK